MDRKKLLAMIHFGQKKAGWDDATYRAWLAKHTGRTSCKDCTNAQLSLAADIMRDAGLIASPRRFFPAPGGSSPSSPTQGQWRLAIKLSKKCGLSGSPDDPGLKTLCARVAKVDSPRFLDRNGMAALINALDGWASKKPSSEVPSCS